MRTMTKTVTGVGSTEPLPMNLNISPFNVGIGCNVTGTANYTVEHTFDDPFASTFDPATATWYPHETLAAQTTDQDGNYAFPVTAVRVRIASGSGSVAMTLAQAGI